MLFALLRNGDHFVSSAFLFGNTNSLFQTFCDHGIGVSFVDATDVEAVAAAINRAYAAGVRRDHRQPPHPGRRPGGDR
jgi:O-acetylhomoserine/O-acetylserine sulfhydrylase-like pyridoxal-dependent enzyme